MTEEVYKLITKIKKLKSRKGKIDLGLKTCKFCTKDFLEDENFLWSCRTHRGDYSNLDDIWWCCGKKGKQQPGCKKQKHEQKEDDEDEEVNILK